MKKRHKTSKHILDNNKYFLLNLFIKVKEQIHPTDEPREDILPKPTSYLSLIPKSYISCVVVLDNIP